jgi:hypothetical protein
MEERSLVVVSQQRWHPLRGRRRALLVLVVAVVAGLTAGGVWYRRGLTGLALAAGVALVAALAVWIVVMPGRLAPPVPRRSWRGSGGKSFVDARGPGEPMGISVPPSPAGSG